MNLRKSEMYADLDRGDGVCRYLDEVAKLCTIYSKRPEKCNIDKTYEKFYKEVLSLEEYYELNYMACNELKKRR